MCRRRRTGRASTPSPTSRNSSSSASSRRWPPPLRSTLAHRKGTMARAKADTPADAEVVEIDEITLDGKRVVVRNQDIPVELLRLDPKNPRIANTVNLQFGPKAASLDLIIEELLWNDSDVRDLYRQVLVNGGLIERIIVRPSNVVAEGNCRLVVYRKLHEK